MVSLFGKAGKENETYTRVYVICKSCTELQIRTGQKTLGLKESNYAVHEAMLWLSRTEGSI